MNENYSLGLAVFDFLPTIAFLVGAFFLVRIGRVCRGSKCGRMVMAGGLLIFLGGFLKALWKTLFVTGVADIQWMSQGQFVFTSTGFLAICVAMIYMVRGSKLPASTAALPAMAVWKIPFLFVLTVCSLGAEGILAYIAFKRKAYVAAAGFVIGVLVILAMAMLSSATQSLTMQWVEEITNTLGQMGFMTGCILLYRNFKAYGCIAKCGA